MLTSKTVVWCAVAAAALLMGMGGCETSHTESTKPTWTGGEKHEETTVYTNPITGGTSVEHEKQVTNP